jgi:hypothetical protein
VVDLSRSLFVYVIAHTMRTSTYSLYKTRTQPTINSHLNAP